MELTPVRRSWGYPRRIVKSLAAVGGSSIIAASAWLSPAAAAEDDDTSYARGRFLSGQIGGIDLDNIVELAGAEVRHTGFSDPITEGNPLEVDVARTQLIDIPGGVQIPLGDFIELGAVNQYATAEHGTARAGSGAVADNGAVGTGVRAGFPGSATIHLGELLGPEASEQLGDVALHVEAVSAEAHVVPPPSDADRTDYDIVELELIVGIPALADAAESLIADVPALNQRLCGGPLAAGTPVEIDVCGGSVRIDLDSLTDGTISEMPPNTELLSQAELDAITARIGKVNVLSLGGDDLITGIGPAIDDLDSLISVRVNVQGDEVYGWPASNSRLQAAGPAQAQMESQAVTALQLRVGDGELATIDLAQAVAATAVDDGQSGDENGDGGEGGDEDGNDGGSGDEAGGNEGGDGGGAGGGDVGGPGGDVPVQGDDTLPATGSDAPTWLLVLGLALIVGGGGTAYLVGRRGSAESQPVH